MQVSKMQNHSSAVFQHASAASSQQVQVQGGALGLAMVQFPEQEQLRCPRCESSNTKFCYYNNYNLSQPRHFCKACRRYWTKGGALRNIPVGGGSRKSSGSSSSVGGGSPSSKSAGKEASPTTSSKRANPDRNPSENQTIDLEGESMGKKVRGAVIEDLNSKEEGYLQNGEWSGWPDLSIYTPPPDFE